MLKKITILATTDVHSNIWGYNYENNEEMSYCGMANLYTYIKEVRKNNPNTILVDNGDILQGTLLTDDLYNRGWEKEHPLATVMNYMGYDAMNLGNHEFNFDLKILKSFEKELRFPVISANTVYKMDEKNFVKPYSIVEKSGVRIGIIGLTTPMVPQWVGNKVEKLKFLNLAETTRKYVNEIREKADIIIVLAHCSLDGEINPCEDAARNIIEVCPEVDVLVVGHFHITIKDEINNTIIGGATDKGREIIHFNLYLNEENKLVNKNVKIVDMKNFKPSNEIRKLPIVNKAHDETINLAHGEVLGKAFRDFQPRNEINWIPQGRLEETPIIQLINKVQLLNSGAEVSATSLIREDCNISKGYITYGTICSIYKFDTKLYVVELTGKQLRAYMEWTASAYNQLKEGDVSISFSKDIPGYQHDFFSGITFNIDLTQPVGKRIVDLKLKGELVKSEQLIKLAVSDYCYYTTLKGRGFTEVEPIWKSVNLVKEMLVDYIRKVKLICPELDGNWKLIGMNFDETVRSELISKVNSGVLDIPYNKSLNILELKKSGII